MNSIPGYVQSAAWIAFGMVSWPLLAKASGTPAAWVTMLALVGTVLGNLAVGWHDMADSPLFTLKSLAIMLVAVLVNGVAVYYYGAKSVDPNIPSWNFVAAINIMMVIFATCLGSAIAWSFPSLRQVFGIALACIGIYFIVSK